MRPDGSVATKASRLRSARRKAGFRTASLAANALSVAVPTYVHHENGTRDFSNAAAEAYAVKYGVTAHWLLFGEEASNSRKPTSQALDTTKLALLLEVAERAVVSDGLRLVRKAEEAMLSEAYQRWKAQAGIVTVQRDTRQWDMMMEATREQYQMTEAARREERNAVRRLETTIARYRKAIGVTGSEVILSLARA